VAPTSLDIIESCLLIADTELGVRGSGSVFSTSVSVAVRRGGGGSALLVTSAATVFGEAIIADVCKEGEECEGCDPNLAVASARFADCERVRELEPSKVGVLGLLFWRQNSRLFRKSADDTGDSADAGFRTYFDILGVVEEEEVGAGTCVVTSEVGNGMAGNKHFASVGGLRDNV
jgi:hypothetical protein